MSDNQDDGQDNEYEDVWREALRQASGELSDENLEGFALISYDGDQAKVTMQANQVHNETEMPMPQMLLATFIYNLAQRTDTQPLRIGQAATYAAEQIFHDATDAEWVRDFTEELEQYEDW